MKQESPGDESSGRSGDDSTGSPGSDDSTGSPGDESTVDFIDEVFAEFADQVLQGEEFDAEESLDRIQDDSLRERMRLLIENYRNRAAPRKVSAFGSKEGRWLGEFELLGELGHGGMGAVYVARDTSLNRKVALKVLPRKHSRHDRVIRRFCREAEAAARLRHRNIIPIYRSGQIEGTYFYTMEYVPGITLAELLRALRGQRFSKKGPLSVRRIEEDGEQVLRLVHKTVLDDSKRRFDRRKGSAPGVNVLTFSRKSYVREALKLFLGVAEALEYAHGEGVVHRDIKPSNLILAPDGRLMLADFGLAKVGDAETLTRTGDFMGSPSYSSPEQAMARRIPQDHRTDIWSLGVTLYEFLTLEHPFSGASIDLTLKNVITRDPRPPRAVNPRLPKDVETIILRMLEKSPDRRYPTAEAVAADFRSVLNYESIQAKTVGPITRGLRLVRRHTAVFAVGILSVALVVGGAWAYKGFRDQERRDLERHFEWVRNIAVRPGDPLLDEDSIDSLQRSLWRAISSTGDVGVAIDQLSRQTIEGVRAQQHSQASLREAMESLARVRLIHLHNPDRVERERLERIDRATAESRIRLLWEIADRLHSLGEAEPQLTYADRPDQLWDWLCVFVGTRELIPGFREENSMVRLNALDAMSSLPGYRSRFVGELQRVLGESPLDPRIQRAAVLEVREIPGLQEDRAALDLLAEILRKDQHSAVPFRVRLQIGETLQACDHPDRYYDVFNRLRGDPEPRIRSLATRALRAIERG